MLSPTNEPTSSFNINAAIGAAIENIISFKGVDYVVRTAGSFITLNGGKLDGGQTLNFLKACDWKEVTEDIEAQGSGFGTCRYFKAEIPSPYKGQKAAVSIDEFVQYAYDMEMDMSRLYVRVNPVKDFGGNAAHANELTSASISSVPEKEVYIIIGNDSIW